MTKVFISYSSVDDGWAKKIAIALGHLGIEHFLDRKDVRWGDTVVEVVSDGMKSCSDVVVVVSPASLKSQWVAFEVGQAKALGKRLLPLLTHPALDLPDFLRGIHHVRSLAALRRYFRAVNPMTPARRQSDSVAPSASPAIGGPEDSLSGTGEGSTARTTHALTQVAEVRVVLNWGVKWRTESEISIYGAEETNGDIASATAKAFADALRRDAWDQDKAAAGVMAIIQGCFDGNVGTVGFDLSYPCGVYFDRPYCDIEIGFDRRVSSLAKRDQRISQIWVELFRDRMDLNFGDDDGTGLNYDEDHIGSLTVDFRQIFCGARQVAEAFKLEMLGQMGKPFLKTDEHGREIIRIPLAPHPHGDAAQPGVAADGSPARR